MNKLCIFANGFNGTQVCLVPDLELQTFKIQITMNKEQMIQEKQKPQLNIPVVRHSAPKNEDWGYKDEGWRNPFCQIRETATGKVVKDFGVTVHRT